jgi:dihydrofolate reductase
MSGPKDRPHLLWYNHKMFEFLRKKLQPKPPVAIVVAMSRLNRALGNKNQLLWHIPDDLKRFRSLTSGHPIIMGRKTFESILQILGKPLPNRTNIVVTRDATYQHDAAKIVHSLDEAIEVAKLEKPTEIHIGGGAELYKQVLPLVDKLQITWVDDKPEADTFFPPFETEFVIAETHEPREYNGLRYQWVDYVRKS